MMSEQIMRQFRVQVTTTMDLVLRRAVFEVMTIFENTLHDHQMEMAQKLEEVAQLKIKLQAAELRLKDLQSSGPSGEETIQTRIESEVFLDAPSPTSEVPEIDVDVPDDWCAPLGCEVVTKEDDDVCPSVRLRQFSIPLWHIPIRKQEVHNSDFNPKCTIAGRRPQRISSLIAKSKLSRDGKCTVSGLGSQRKPMKNDMKRLLQDMKWAYSDLTGLDGFRTRNRRNDLIQKEQENPTEHKEEQSKQKTVGNNKNKYLCGFCKKVFDTKVDKKTHVCCQNKCCGCKKIFPFPSVLKHHRKYCSQLKTLLEIASNTPKSSSDKKIGPVPFKTQVSKKESTQSSGNVKEASRKKFSCRYCICKFTVRSKLVEHMQSHSHELWYTCSICLMKFSRLRALRVHMTRKHKNHTSSIDVNGDLEWTKPLEDNEKNSVSPRKDTKNRS